MPSAYHIHPEFGYLCPSPSLRRKAKVALALIVLAAIAAASQGVVQIADRESTAIDRVAAIPADASTASSSAANAASSAAAITASSAPATASSAGVVPLPPRVESAVSQSGSVHGPRPGATPAAAVAPARPATATAPAPQQSVAVSKKPQKKARNHDRRRERDLYNAYASEPQRADYGSQHGLSNGFWRR